MNEGIFNKIGACILAEQKNKTSSTFLAADTHTYSFYTRMNFLLHRWNHLTEYDIIVLLFAIDLIREQKNY